MYNVNQISLHGKALKDIDIETLTGMPTHVPSSKLVKQKLDQLGDQIKSEIEVYELTTISTEFFVDVPKHPGLQIKQGSWTVTDYTVQNDYSYTTSERNVPGLEVKLLNSFDGTTYEIPKKIYMRDIEWNIKIVALTAENWSRWTNIYAPDVCHFDKSDAEAPTLDPADTKDAIVHRLDITCSDFEGTMDLITPEGESWRLILHGIQNLDMNGVTSSYKGSVIVDSDKNVGIYRLKENIRDVTLPTNNFCVGTGSLSTGMTVKIPKNSRLSYNLNALGIKNLRVDCYEPDYFLRIAATMDAQSGLPVYYEHPVDRFRLLNEEEHLMERIYRYKANCLNDINFFKNSEGYEQSFKVGITPDSTTGTFVYTADTERTPAKVFLSNWIYDMKDQEYKLVAYEGKTKTDVSYTSTETHTTIIMCQRNGAADGYMAFRSGFPADGSYPLHINQTTHAVETTNTMTEGDEWVCVETGATTDLEELVDKNILYVSGLTAEEQAQSFVVITSAHKILSGDWATIKAISTAGLVAKTNSDDLYIIPLAKINPAGEYEFLYLKQEVRYTGNKTVTFETAKEIKLSQNIQGLIVDASTAEHGVTICYPNIDALSHVKFNAGQTSYNELFITEKDLSEIDLSTGNWNSVGTLRLGYISVIKLFEKDQVVNLGAKLSSTCTVLVPEFYDVPKVKELLGLSADQTVGSYSQRHDY
jgi:hypothetical protein